MSGLKEKSICLSIESVNVCTSTFGESGSAIRQCSTQL